MSSTYQTQQQAALRLRNGAVGVFPVDTVYGLVACAAVPAAVARFYAIKQRTDKPGTVIAASTQQLVSLGIDRAYIERVKHYWPNPISVVLPVSDSLNYVSLGKQSLAVRIPDDLGLRNLLETTGPLITTSANRPGEPTVTHIDQAVKIFGTTVDFYVDGGDYTDRQPSTVILFSDTATSVLRAGAGTAPDLDSQ